MIYDFDFLILQSEGCPYDTHDVHLMLRSLGLIGKHPCDTLLQIQKDLQECCYMTEHYSIVDLLHVAGLVVQLTERGAGLQAAMMNACNDVYVKRLKEFSKRQVSYILWTVVLWNRGWRPPP